MRRIIKINLLFVSIFCLSALDLQLSEAEAIPDIEISDNKLTADIDNEPLRSVLALIKKKTGIRFSFDEDMSSQTVSGHFSSMPIDRALQRILNRSNYAFIYNPDGRIKEVTIIGQNSASVRSSVNMNEDFSTTGSSVIEQRGDEGMTVAQSASKETPDGMKIYGPSDNAVPEGMEIFNAPDKKIPEGMEINASPDKVVPEGMKVFNTPLP